MEALKATAGRRINLHAGGVADESRRVLAVVGPSGTGKTTATLALARRLGYVSDETVSIDPDGTVAPHPKPLSVVPDPQRLREKSSCHRTISGSCRPPTRDGSPAWSSSSGSRGPEGPGQARHRGGDAPAHRAVVVAGWAPSPAPRHGGADRSVRRLVGADLRGDRRPRRRAGRPARRPTRTRRRAPGRRWPGTWAIVSSGWRSPRAVHSSPDARGPRPWRSTTSSSCSAPRAPCARRADRDPLAAPGPPVFGRGAGPRGRAGHGLIRTPRRSSAGRSPHWSKRTSWPSVRWHDRGVTALAFCSRRWPPPSSCVSGWAKMGDVTGMRLAFVAMGVPAALSRPIVVRALPYAELALGLALLLTWGWLLAAVGALTTALFVVYAVLVARVLREGDSVECNCFGSLGGDRVTSATLARNIVLVALAAIATAFGAGGSGVIPALGDLEGAEWWWPVMTGLVVLAAVLVVRPGPAAETPVDDEDDYLRQPIPMGVLETEDGRCVQLRHLAAQRPQLLVFLSVGCGSCHVLADLLPGIAERLGPRGGGGRLLRAARQRAGLLEGAGHHAVPRPGEGRHRPLHQRPSGRRAVRCRRAARGRARWTDPGGRDVRRRHRGRARGRDSRAAAPATHDTTTTTTTTTTMATTTGTATGTGTVTRSTRPGAQAPREGGEFRARRTAKSSRAILWLSGLGGRRPTRTIKTTFAADDSPAGRRRRTDGAHRLASSRRRALPAERRALR